jgi:DNA helicase-2/ATP-dependent DNA helicase PcrA
MYRTNAQSRVIEEAFLRAGLPYRLVGATRFYGRREIKDILAYLRLIHNPDDSVSLMRVINTPPRGIGDKTVGALLDWASGEGLSTGDALDRLAHDATAGPFSGRARNALHDFARTLDGWRTAREELSVGNLLKRVLEDTVYRTYINDGTTEGEERWENVAELLNVATEYEALPLAAFLEDVSLVSDIDNLPAEAGAPTLLTLHAAKGLEFGVVFLVGLEEGLLPHSRSYDDPEAMAEERRLMYVGMTRAKHRLYLVYAFQRSTWGGRELALVSRFLEDIPGHLLTGNRVVGARRGGMMDRAAYRQATSWPAQAASTGDTAYRAGQRVSHPKFGEGLVIESRASGEDQEVTVVFDEAGLKRLLASLANLEILDSK